MNTFEDFDLHFKNIHVAISNPSRKNLAIRKHISTCAKENISIMDNLKSVRSFLNNCPSVDKKTLSKMCCLNIKHVEKLLTVLDFEVVAVDAQMDAFLILNRGYDKQILEQVKSRLDFATRYLSSLDNGDRHCYFGNVNYKDVTIRLMWGSCSQFDEIGVDNKSIVKFWMSVCVSSNQDNVTRWLSDMVAYSLDHGHPRVAVYNKNTCTIEGDSIKLQAYIKTWRLYCEEDCLDPFTFHMKNIVYTIVNELSPMCGTENVACNCDRGDGCEMIAKIQENILKTFDLEKLNSIVFEYVEKMKDIKLKCGLLF